MLIECLPYSLADEFVILKAKYLLTDYFFNTNGNDIVFYFRKTISDLNAVFHITHLVGYDTLCQWL